ncbi:MAG: LCP family protein [Eubacteriales bacterium]
MKRIKINKNIVVYFVFGIGFIILITASMVLGYANHPKENNEETQISEGNKTKDKVKTKAPETKKEVESLTGLLVGYDNSGILTDVLMVGYLDTETNRFKIISIPRDLLIDFREEPFKEIKKNNNKNRVLYCKINEIYQYLGKDKDAFEDLIKVIEGIIDMDIDYYLKIDLEGFRAIVDTVDGVPFYVPQDMKKSSVEDLKIDLDEGYQTLYGNEAEQLVRFRDYQYGDLTRVEVQRQFLTALVNKVLKESNWEQLLNVIDTGYNYVETDIEIMDLLTYVRYVFNAEQEFFHDEDMITIPSYGIKIDNIWYQEWHKDEVDTILEETIK